MTRLKDKDLTVTPRGPYAWPSVPRAPTAGTIAGLFPWLENTLDPHTGLLLPASRYGLINFRLIADDGVTLTYGWDSIGSLISSVWCAANTYTLASLPTDPWADVQTSSEPLPRGTTRIEIARPTEGSITLVQVEPRQPDLTPGAVQRLAIQAAPTQIPAFEFDDAEIAGVGTQWWKITERGLAVTSVDVQTQVGNAPISAFAAPTRSAGATSVVRGGTLGAGEYEQDVTLDSTRLSWIVPRITLSNGQVLVLSPFGFDRTIQPTIIEASVVGTVITVRGDDNTRSIRLYDAVSGWEYWQDGPFVRADATVIGTNGIAGMSSTDTRTIEVDAYSAEKSVVAADTFKDVRNVIAAGTAPAASWAHVTAATPSSTSAVAEVTIEATAAPAGWTVRIRGTWAPDSLSNTDIGSSLSPAFSTTPPTTAATYSYTVTNRPSGDRPGRFTFTAELLDGTGAIMDSATASVTLYAIAPT